MNKIILHLSLFFSWVSFGQVCHQTFTVSGLDNAPTVLSVALSDLDCHLGDISSITISAATLGVDGQCGQLYSFSANIDGVVSSLCAEDLEGMNVSNFESIEITSANIGGWSSNNITMSLTFTVSFATAEVPYCNATLLFPENEAQNTPATGELVWSQATGASGYRLSVGTSVGGADVLDMFDVGSLNSYNIPGFLNPLTTYYVSILPYNQNGNADGPCEVYLFTTCEAFDNLSESFDGLQISEIPTCWSMIRSTSDEWASINFYDGGVGFYNSGDLSAKLLLVSPSLPTLSAGTHRLKFKAGAGEGYTLLVGTMSDPSDASSFTALQTITTNAGMTDYSIVFDVPSADKYIAFKHGLGGAYRSIKLDSFVWEEVSDQVPGCIVDDIEIISDNNCGNFMNELIWDVATFADGYRLTMGTSSGGNDVFDNVDLGNVTSYSFLGSNDTEYYFTLTPYNASGNAVGCEEYGFVTAANACYCEAVPDQNNFDGSGITNIKLGNTSLIVAPVTYTDFTDGSPIGLYQALNANLKITFSTGYTYDTHVWIDLNDDSNFTENERVFSGESGSAFPTIFDASFAVPATATVGAHRMRIASANYLQQIPDPCYNGAYGVNVDLLVDILPAPLCLPPTSTTVTSISANSAVLNWVSGGAQFNIQYSSNLSFTPGEGILITGVEGGSQHISSLDSETDYEYYIQRDCGGDLSPWFGPYSFRTGCDAFGSFTENFDGISGIPECWYSIVNSSSSYATVLVYPFSSNVYITNAGDAQADLLLVTPALADLPNNTYRLKFKARASFSGQTLLVGTITDPANALSFSLNQTIVLDTAMTEYIVAMNQPGMDMHAAFKHGLGATFRDIVIDDFSWELNPTTIPDCATVEVFADDYCGNYPTEFSWETVQGADGYRLSIGTGAGQTDVLNAVDLANATSYLFAGTAGTSYFYTLAPYNSFGNASCIEGTFTTASNPCYCISVPTSLDGDGITGIQVGGTSFLGNGETYIDFTAEESPSLQAGAEANIQVSFNTYTGFFSPSYKANIWIDFNDDFSFTANELVYTGYSGAVSPTTLNASFNLLPTANPGVHRMRIASAISGQFNPDPCYSGSYGVSIDLMVSIQEDLKVDVNGKESFVYYPNPVDDFLNVSHSADITNIEVFNLIGQVLISKKINTVKGKIDMSGLPSGAYMVKISSGDQSKTLKVIKK